MYRWCSRCNERRSQSDAICPVCRSSTDIELDLGDTLRIDSKREFRITKHLSSPGEAGMSAVYLAERKDRPEMYGAIKLAKLNRVEALKREAEVLQKLHHPHIIRLVHPERALWQDRKDGESLHFFALEYMDGGSLKERLQRDNKLPLAEALPIIMAVGQALQYAHEQGMVHLDVKPANILFSRDGRIVLSDFGVARDVLHLRQLTRRVGTLFYNSPEQLAEPAVHTHKADIYALGIILYEMLVGADKFRQYRGSSSKSSGKDDPRQAGRRPALPPPLPTPRRLEPGIPRPVERVILKATAANPDQRYPSVAAMLEDLVRAAQEPAGPSKVLVLGLAGLGAALAVALIVGGMAFFMLSSRGRTPTPGQPAASPTVPAVPAAETGAAPPVVVVGPSPTPAPTATPAAGPTDREADQLVLAPSPTVTRAPTPTSRPVAAPVATPALRLEGRLELVEPANDIQLPANQLDFRWRWLDNANSLKGCEAELPPGYGFQIRIWPDRDDPAPPGVIDAASQKPTCDPATGIRGLTVENVNAAPGIKDMPDGRFRWDVAVIELKPPYNAVIQAPYRILFH